jgi:hypothetical protein
MAAIDFGAGPGTKTGDNVRQALGKLQARLDALAPAPNPTLPVLSISAPSSIGEGQSGSTAVVFTLSRTGDTSQQCSVTFTASGGPGNPLSANDVVGDAFPSSTQTLAAGQASKTVAVQVKGEAIVEGNEVLRGTISSPSGCTIGTATADVTILNDDVPSSDPDPTLPGITNWRYGSKTGTPISLAANLPATLRADDVLRFYHSATINGDWDLVSPGHVDVTITNAHLDDDAPIVWAGLAGVPSPVYGQIQQRRGSGGSLEVSAMLPEVPLLHGSGSTPALTGTSSFSVTENTDFTIALQVSEPIKELIVRGGTHSGQFKTEGLASLKPLTSAGLDLESGGPATREVTIGMINFADTEGVATLSVTVLDQDEVPALPLFEDVDEVELSTMIYSGPAVVADLGAGIPVPFTADTEMRKNGGTWLPANSLVTLVNGNTIEVRRESGATNTQETFVNGVIGHTPFQWKITTVAAVGGFALLGMISHSDPNYPEQMVVEDVPVRAGRNLLFFMRGGNGGNASAPRVGSSAGAVLPRLWPQSGDAIPYQVFEYIAPQDGLLDVWTNFYHPDPGGNISNGLGIVSVHAPAGLSGAVHASSNAHPGGYNNAGDFNAPLPVPAGGGRSVWWVLGDASTVNPVSGDGTSLGSVQPDGSTSVFRFFEHTETTLPSISIDPGWQYADGFGISFGDA